MRFVPALAKVLALSAALAAAACSAPEEEPAVVATADFVRTPRGGANMTAGYLSLTSASDDALIAATSPLAQTIEIHTVVMEDGVARMKMLEALPLPAGETVTLEPGGNHLMIMGLIGEVVPSEPFPVTLTFRNAPPVTLDLPVAAQ